jgi:hypothetical protein
MPHAIDVVRVVHEDSAHVDAIGAEGLGEGIVPQIQRDVLALHHGPAAGSGRIPDASMRIPFFMTSTVARQR